jgi:hypothetical protein
VLSKTVEHSIYLSSLLMNPVSGLNTVHPSSCEVQVETAERTCACPRHFSKGALHSFTLVNLSSWCVGHPEIQEKGHMTISQAQDTPRDVHRSASMYCYADADRSGVNQA